MRSRIDEKLKQRNVDLHRLLRIYLWVIIGLSIAIFCFLVIIGTIVIYLLVTNQLGRLENPLVYNLYVTVATFVIADIVCLVGWFIDIHFCMLRAFKMKDAYKTKKFNIANLVFLVVFFLSNIAVITLAVFVLGGYVATPDVRWNLGIALASLEVFKGLIMVGVLTTTGLFLTQIRKNKK